MSDEIEQIGGPSDWSRCEGCNQRVHPYYDKKYQGYCLNCFNSGLLDKDEEILLLRKVIKLMIGRENNLPWHQVREEDVEGYLKFAVELEEPNG